MNFAWTCYVIVIVAIVLLGCLWLLLGNVKRRATDPKPDETGHTWDGTLTEFNNPLPRWWINLFLIAIVFAVCYLCWYGVGALQGFGHWSSRSEWKEETTADEAAIDKALTPYKGKSIDVLAKDQQAIGLGRTIFSNQCASCHGATGRGSIGFPNLTDDVWYWGGTSNRILETIQHGRTFLPDKPFVPGQKTLMPAWGLALTQDKFMAAGGSTALDDTIAYVLKLAGSTSQSADAVARGEKMFAANCLPCHGPEGKGNQSIGSRNLTLPMTWLYSHTAATDAGLAKSIRTTITEGRNSTMPAWLRTDGGVLSDTQTRLVGAYVWSLSPTPASSPDKKPIAEGTIPAE